MADVGRMDESPLHYASRSGNLEAVSLLLGKGADPSVMGKNGTAMDVALSSNLQDCIDLLSSTSDASRRCTRQHCLTTRDQGALGRTKSSQMTTPRSLSKSCDILSFVWCFLTSLPRGIGA